MGDAIDQNLALLESGQSLTPTERDIFALVKHTCQEFNPPAIARVAGGWVRDKLLGHPNDDVDIAIENATGLSFAERLKENSDSSRIVVIEANPDQSKHLETARVCLGHNFWIDVCGLRTDHYAIESRIPQVKQGTPQEDSLRRDFTINALFFNINTSKVEDFTGGLADLKVGVLRTPLDPLESFGDDPLRILRAFRFASRFNFKLDDSIIPAAQQVRDDFERKITRERINVELTKALEGNNPRDTIKYLIDSQLFDIVFDREKRWNLDPVEALQRVDIVLSRIGNEMKLELVMGAIYSPIAGLGRLSDTERTSKKIPVIEYALSRLLRMPVKTALEIDQMLKGTATIGQIPQELTRTCVGQWIRSVGKDWLYSTALIFEPQLFERAQKEIVPYIKEQDMSNVWEMKPLLNGKEIAELHGIKPSRELRTLIEDLVNWQLENPNGTADDYKLFVNSKK